MRMYAWAGAAAAGALVAFAVGAERPAQAADHQESPLTAEDPAADLGDFYAWHTDGGSLVMVATYAGYATPNAEAVYDADVLYGFHVSTNGDAVAEHDIEVRFGQNAAGDWGLRADRVPGHSAPIEGPVATDLEGDGGARVHAGIFDDPFFFDLEGFMDTLSTGTLAFDASRDFAAFQNTNAIVIEVPLEALGGDSSALRVWATTARK